MLNPTLHKYAKAFAKLKRGGTKCGAAPHKPILLLSIIELIEKGILTDNRVCVDAQLVGTFKENWLFIDTPNQEIIKPFSNLAKYVFYLYIPVKLATLFRSKLSKALV